MAKVKTLVVNFDEDGKFLSATKQNHNVTEEVEGENVSVPQRNESIEAAEVREIVGNI